MGSKSLLDLMSKEEAEKAIQRAKKRQESRKSKSVAVSPEMFLVGEMGYYFGWDAILAIRRGYTMTVDTEGKPIKEPFTLEEAEVLVEAAKKVWYSKVVDQAHGAMIGNSLKLKTSSFNDAVKPYSEKAKVEE